MANIYCTKKLEKALGKSLMGEEEVENEFGNWNANLFYLFGKKCLILTNDISFYTLFFANILKSDLKNFKDLFIFRLLEQMDYDGITMEKACRSRLIESANPVFLPTNNNRKVLGTMNQFVRELPFFLNLIVEYPDGSWELREFNNRFNATLVGAIKERKSDFGQPLEEMHALLAKVCK